MADRPVDRRWALAVDHGTSVTVGAVADVDPADGWVRVSTVTVEGSVTVPSVVLSRPDGTVLAGRDALAAAPGDPPAAVLRARSYLAAADGRPDGPEATPLTTWPRPTSAVNVATALVAKVFHTEAGRRGTLPERLVLLHPASWSAAAREALAGAGRAVLAAVPRTSPEQVVLLPGPAAAAVRLGGSGPVAVVDLGGGGTEIAVVDRTGDGAAAGPAVRPGARAVEVGGEALDDALAQLVLDRAPADLAQRLRFGGDLEAHRAWFGLRTAVHAAREALVADPSATVSLPVLPPESPGPATVTLTHDDLGGAFAPGLDEVGAALADVLGGDRVPLLVRGGASRLPGVRDWLAERSGCPLAEGDPGASGPTGPVTGAAARCAPRT